MCVCVLCEGRGWGETQSRSGWDLNTWALPSSICHSLTRGAPGLTLADTSSGLADKFSLLGS